MGLCLECKKKLRARFEKGDDGNVYISSRDGIVVCDKCKEMMEQQYRG